MKQVLDFIHKNIDVQISIHEQNDQICLCRNLQHFFSLKPFSGSNQAIFEKILSHAIAAEKLYPGGGYFFLKNILNVENDADSIFIASSKNELINQFNNLNLSNLILNMLLEGLDLASTETTFMIKKSTNSSCSIEYNEGYRFNLVCQIIDKKSVKLIKPKVVCIDGYIESVAEIHHLLQKFSETQEDCLLFCRGMSDDVRHTIKVNLDRSTLNVIPYIVPFDLDACNTLVDIAVIANCDVISNTKGQLISSIDYSKLGTLEKCDCLNHTIVMYNTNTRNSVLNHIKNLKKKIEENLEIESFITRRLQSLTASCVEFRLPDDLNYRSNCQQLDEGIRILSKTISKQRGLKKSLDDIFNSYEALKTDLVFTNF